MTTSDSTQSVQPSALDAASLLKQWLRELPEPILPSHVQDALVKWVLSLLCFDQLLHQWQNMFSSIWIRPLMALREMFKAGVLLELIARNEFPTRCIVLLVKCHQCIGHSYSKLCLNYSLWNCDYSCAKIKDKETKDRALVFCTLLLPSLHSASLSCIMRFLKAVSEESVHNKMDARRYVHYIQFFCSLFFAFY